ncbi:alanine racemase [Candidatus Ruthia magnifica str. Cm (Calyptogena magnifica)]|uniref:Alanine racemase n=1 Tax=Ruthia magnifica subsp. Calyptogena magnifica TaxID=413404 RepID=A1AWV3_RUTMC|nr:alanine racemase [Candidatus Ruthturnera calyptogenae]ABL02410.1 alanine racemase [Candidatus Ruthia magnifica str. Cm (Calyptogena magnifica)]
MRAIASISQSALKHNLSVVKKNSLNTRIVSMVKANAYGHHIDLIDPIINHSDLLGVSEILEAEKLRKTTNQPILLLSGVIKDQELQQAIKLNCQIVVHDKTQLSVVNNTKQAIDIWIKINTGMNRLGLSTNEYNHCIKLLGNNPLINIQCIMSHFACADEINHPMNQSQLFEFKKLTDPVVAKRSMANSAAILSNSASHFDYVRPGIMLYGVSPFNIINHNLKPVMQLSAPIMSIKTIKADDSVGYGVTWTADKSTAIATIGIGYGDGYPRHAKNGTPVLINNTLCPLVGRVSMDLICVDISNINASVGDNAILWGNKQLRIETIAKHSATIAYELLAGISSRVTFINAI